MHKPFYRRAYKNFESIGFPKQTATQSFIAYPHLRSLGKPINGQILLNSVLNSSNPTRRMCNLWCQEQNRSPFQTGLTSKEVRKCSIPLEERKITYLFKLDYLSRKVHKPFYRRAYKNFESIGF